MMSMSMMMSKCCCCHQPIDIDADARAGDYSSSDIIDNWSIFSGVNDDNDQQQHDVSPYYWCSDNKNKYDNEHEQQAKVNVDGDNDSDATTLDGEDSCDKIDHGDKNDDDVATAWWTC